MKLKGLTIIAIICLLIIIWIDFIDFKLPELIIGKGAKFEYVIENLCLSYIAGYIFYYLNIYLSERNEKRLILPFVARNVLNLIVNNYSIITCLKNQQKYDFSKYPTEEEFLQLLTKTNPKDKVPFYYKNENWLFLFRNRQNSTLDYINRIFLSGKHIDEHLRKLLLEIQYSLYLKDNYAFNSSDFNEENLSKYYKVFYNYFVLIQDLNEYYNKNLKKYYMTDIKPWSFEKRMEFRKKIKEKERKYFENNN